MKRFLSVAIAATSLLPALAAGQYATGSGIIRPSNSTVGEFYFRVFTEVATNGHLKYMQRSATANVRDIIYLPRVMNAAWTQTSVRFWGWGTYNGRRAWIVAQGWDFQPGPTTVLDRCKIEAFEGPTSAKRLFYAEGALHRGDINIVP